MSTMETMWLLQGLRATRKPQDHPAVMLPQPAPTLASSSSRPLDLTVHSDVAGSSLSATQRTLPSYLTQFDRNYDFHPRSCPEQVPLRSCSALGPCRSLETAAVQSCRHRSLEHGGGNHRDWVGKQSEFRHGEHLAGATSGWSWSRPCPAMVSSCWTMPTADGGQSGVLNININVQI